MSTFPKGTAHPRAKLTDEQVQMIRDSREPAGLLAACFGVSTRHIQDIRATRGGRPNRNKRAV